MSLETLQLKPCTGAGGLTTNMALSSLQPTDDIHAPRASLALVNHFLLTSCPAYFMARLCCVKAQGRASDLPEGYH